MEGARRDPGIELRWNYGTECRAGALAQSVDSSIRST
jgi:hypothetical protein